MSNESLPQPEDELSDEQLQQIAGGDGNTVQPASTPNLTADTSTDTQVAIEKIELVHEKIERVGR